MNNEQSKGKHHDGATVEGPETWSEEYSKGKRKKSATPYKTPYRRSRSYSPNTPFNGFYRNPSPLIPNQSRNTPSSRSRRGRHTASGQHKPSFQKQDGQGGKTLNKIGPGGQEESKKDSDYGSHQSRQSSMLGASYGSNKQMGRRKYPECYEYHGAERSFTQNKKGNSATANRNKSAEKLRLGMLRQELVEDSSLTSTSQCSTDNSGNGKSTEADVESSQDEITQRKPMCPDYGDFDEAGHRYHPRQRQNRSFEHFREAVSHESVFNMSMPTLPAHSDASTGVQHTCNVSAASACSSKSDHVLQWLQQNARQGILNAAPPPTPAQPSGCIAVHSKGTAAMNTMCPCATCKPPVSPVVMSNKLLEALQQASVQPPALINQSLTCQFQGATTNQEGQGILALLRPQDIVCSGVSPLAACDMQQCPNCVQSSCSCGVAHSNANTSGGIRPTPQFHSPQRTIHQFPQAHMHSIFPTASPLRHAAIAPHAVYGGSPYKGTVICGNTLHQGVVQPSLNICGSPLRPSGVGVLSNTVCSSPLQQARAPGLDDSMISSISAIQLYQSPGDKSSTATKDDKNNSSLDNPPPIGVFWDIENCAVPRGKSALNVAQRIRDRFFGGHREAEFMCVCDISKESPLVIQELNDAQVTVAHINATAKNAADDKLRQSLRRFADTHSPPATVVLISGDVNFAGNLSDLRHRNGMYVILVHGQEASEALKTCANEAIRYHQLVDDLPFRSPAKCMLESNILVVHNLPPRKDPSHIRNRLRQLSENCGGKVIHNSNNNAIIKFPNAESASRAKKRLEGEKVFGNKITISFPKIKPTPGQRPTERTGANCPRRDPSSSPNKRPLEREELRGERHSMKCSTDVEAANEESRQTILPMQLPQLQLPPPPESAPPMIQPLLYPPPPQQYQPSQILQQAIKQLNQQDFSLPIANLQSPIDPTSSLASDQQYIGPTVPASSQQLGGRTQSPIGTPREYQSPIGTPRSASANQYALPSAVRPPSRPPSRSQSPVGVPHTFVPNQPPAYVPSHPHAFVSSRHTSNQPLVYTGGPAPTNAQPPLISPQTLANNRLAAAFKPLDTTSHRSSPEVVVIGDNSKRDRGYNSGRSSEEDRRSDSEVGMYWRQALKATGLLRVTGDAPRASPPIPAHPQGNFNPIQHNQHGSTFKPIPQVQRLTPPMGQSVWNRGDEVESPALRGHYRVPSPMLANSKPKGWQYVPYQDQKDTQGIEMLITNLDYQMDRRELKRHLITILGEHCKVLHLIFGEHVGGQFQAVVRVASMADAIRVLANVNRYQIGSRLLHVTVLPRSNSNSDKLRLMIIPMLQEIPGMCLPLFKFKAAFEMRYQQQLYVADLYQITDTVTMRDSNVGKLVCLTTTGSRPNTPISSGINSPSPASRQSPVPFMPPREPTPEPCEEFCSVHDTDTEADIDARNTDPFVVISLRTFAAQVHTLLQMHEGRMPFISFPMCYAAEFSPLVFDGEDGVPLEHLITCVQGVRVGISRDGFKTVCWSQNRVQEQPEEGTVSRSGTPLLPTQLFQFSKEAVELLKHSPRCRLAFSKFIPAYHHHFGRQCRVADYGYMKLVELFEAISHVLQTLGATEHKLLVLTHRAQVKRFSQDLLKVLKSQASKQVTLQEFPSAYQRTFGRPFDIVDYGMCDVQDLLVEVPEGMLTVSWNGEETIIFIPKREQTSEEQIKMKKFGREVSDLLSRHPRYRILFSKFIPAYHHFFGHQCRVAEYGFNKLAELFDALSDVVLVEEQGEDRMVTLIGPERVAAIARLTSMLLHKNRQLSFPLESLMHNYTRAQGYPVFLADFGVDRPIDLIAKFPHVVKVKVDCGEQWLHLVEQTDQSQLAQQVLVVMMEAPDGQLSLHNFPASYYQIWEQWLMPTEYGYSKMVLLLKTLHHVVVVRDEWGDTCTIELTPTYQFARKARTVLLAQYDSLALTMQDFVTRYCRKHNTELQPSDFGHATLASLVCSVPRVLSLMGKGYRRIVTLNPCCLGPSRKARVMPNTHAATTLTHLPAAMPGVMGTEPQFANQSTACGASAAGAAESMGMLPNSGSVPSQIYRAIERVSGPDNMGPPPVNSDNGRHDLLCHGSVPSTAESPVLQPDAVPSQCMQRNLIDFESSLDIPDLLNTSELEQVTRKFTIPPRSFVMTQVSTTVVSDTSGITQSDAPSSYDSAIQADGVSANSAPSGGSTSPGAGNVAVDEDIEPSSPTASSSSKSPRKTPRKCKLAVNFSVPLSK